MRHVLIGIAVFVFSSALAARAAEPVRPQSVSFFDQAWPQKHYRLPDAKVAWVDYDLMRNDFPELQGLSDDRIDQLILDEFARVSELQLKLRGIRVSDFRVTEGDATWFVHPPRYFRAAVAPLQYEGHDLGIVDLKGSGHAEILQVEKQVREFEHAKKDYAPAWRDHFVDQLRVADHSDGAASLGEILAEVTKQQAIQASYDIGKARGRTVEAYFVISTGFDILKKSGERIPAGIIGRQAHLRGRSFTDPESSRIFSDDHGGFQRSALGSNVDFGGVIVKTDEVASHFGTLPGGNPRNPQDSRAWAWGHDTAKAFVEKSKQDPAAARALIERHLQDMLGPLAGPWKKARKMKFTLAEQANVLVASLDEFRMTGALVARLVAGTRLEKSPELLSAAAEGFFAALMKDDALRLGRFRELLMGLEKQSPGLLEAWFVARLRRIADEGPAPGQVAKIVEFIGPHAFPDDIELAKRLLAKLHNMTPADAKALGKALWSKNALQDPEVRKLIDAGVARGEPRFQTVNDYAVRAAQSCRDWLARE